MASLKVREFQKRHGKECVNLWNHLSRTQGACEFNQAARDVLKLRELHRQMDQLVLQAYAWEDIDLAHDFYEVDYLPENDRIRYTIAPAARKTILKRLLALNHAVHAREEATGGLPKSQRGGGKPKKRLASNASKQMQMF